MKFKVTKIEDRDDLDDLHGVYANGVLVMILRGSDEFGIVDIFGFAPSNGEVFHDATAHLEADEGKWVGWDVDPNT